MIGIIKFLDNNKSAFVENEDGEKLFVHGKYSKFSMTGDLVEAVVIKEKAKNSSKCAEGKVKQIIERNTDSITGILEIGNGFAFVRPTVATGYDIFIPVKHFNGAKDGDVVEVKIEEHPKHKRNPAGSVIRVVGSSECTETAIEVVKIKGDINSVFSEKVMSEVEDIIGKAEIEMEEYRYAKKERIL